MSLLLVNQIPDARKLVLSKSGIWVRGPTFEIIRPTLRRIMNKIAKSLSGGEEHKKYSRIAKYLSSTSAQISPKISSNFDFDLEVADAMAGDLSRVVGNQSPGQTEVRTFQYQRDPAVVAYALKKAKGVCGDCGNPAPFVSSKTGLPYLEVHHIKMLKSGGSDTIDNVIALCPNCHRKRHYG